MFETGVVGKAARSSEEDKATESNRMREGNERATESEEDVRERCTARYCLDVDTALMTFHLPGVSFCLSVSVLPLSLTEVKQSFPLS